MPLPDQPMAGSRTSIIVYYCLLIIPRFFSAVVEFPSLPISTDGVVTSKVSNQIEPGQRAAYAGTQGNAHPPTREYGAADECSAPAVSFLHSGSRYHRLMEEQLWVRRGLLALEGE